MPKAHGAPASPEAGAAIEEAEATLRRFRSLQKQYRYHDILLVDPDGRVRLSLKGYAGTHHAGAAAALALAFRQRRPVLTELHTEKDDPTPHIGVVAPLFPHPGEASSAVGAVVLVSDAREFLFPLIQSWPVPSRTAETLLVRRDNDHVLFLNDLRHQPDTALKLRIPLSREDVPAVMAVLGQEGVHEGKDYRGVEVLAVIKTIPRSPWFMVAKIDTKKAFAIRRFRSVLILLLLSGVAALAGLSLLLLRQREGKAHYRALYQSEAARRRSEERHRITLRGIGDGVIGTDAQGRMELLNSTAEALTGWTEAEARGRPVDEVFRIINEETRETVENPVVRVLREGVVVGLANHTLLMARDGVKRPIADSGAPILDGRGAVTGVVLVFRDQTEERAAMEALRTARREWQATFDAMLDPVALLAPDGTVQQYNQAFTSLFEDETGSLTGHRCFRLIHKTEDHIPGCSLVRARRSGTRENMELPMGDRTFLVTVDPIKALSGEMAGYVHIMRDITERKLAEARLGESEETYRNLFQNAQVGLFRTRISDGKILESNEQLARMFGYDSREAFVAEYATAINYVDPDTREKMLDEIRNDGVLKDFEARFYRKDGSVFWARYSARIYPDKGWIEGVAEDITGRKRVEEEKEKLQKQLQQAQKMESVGRLAGGVAHDFNNMLGIILGYTEMAIEEVSPGTSLRNSLHEIRKAAGRSADLTRQLLAFARKQTIDPKVLDLNATVEGMLKMLSRLIGEDIDLAWLPGPALWPVKMDPAQVDQLLANLCVNARDAIAGVGKVTIETGNVCFDEAYCANHAGSVSGDYVMLAVSDNGCGMDEETMRNLFDPFFTTKEVGKGTGLGLATVYGIVKQNNGYINVYSEPGRGTTFKIYLPRHGAGVVEAEPARSTDFHLGRGETVLMVEDEPALLAMGKAMLEKLGYTVLGAADPAQALRLAHEHTGEIHLLMTDLVMPQMNGRDLAERLMSDRPAMKCLFMSGYTANVIAHHGVLDARVHFIQKPFSIKDLGAKVREVLDLGTPSIH